MSYRTYSLVFAAVFLLLCVSAPVNSYAWPFGKKENKSASTPAARKSEAKKSVSENDAANQDGVPVVPNLPQVINTANVPDLPKVPQTIAIPAEQDPEIVRIRKQIQDIIKINESLKLNYASQAAEIQKISEQAKIHQKILQDLEGANLPPQPTAVGSEGYLNQEKVRLIQKETERNQKFLDSLQAQDIPKTNKVIPIQEQETKKS